MKIALATLAGIALGFVYYRVVGCSTGACPLTSNPWISMALGGLFAGSLAASG